MDGSSDNNLQKSSFLDKLPSDRRSFVQRLLGLAGFAVPTVRTVLMGSAAGSLVTDAFANSCPSGMDISYGLQNPSFAGNPGAIPTNWIASGSPAPGFASYSPTSAQYTGGSPFLTAAYSPTVFSGSGVIRQISSLTWAPGTYVLNLWAGLPKTEPDGTTPVVGFPQAPSGVARLYLTMGPGYGQVAAFDIPAPAPGTFASNIISFTLPANSPAVGQSLGVMIFVSAPSGYSADFVITSDCPTVTTTPAPATTTLAPTTTTVAATTPAPTTTTARGTTTTQSLSTTSGFTSCVA
jgi:hypothetical protein